MIFSFIFQIIRLKVRMILHVILIYRNKVFDISNFKLLFKKKKIYKQSLNCEVIGIRDKSIQIKKALVNIKLGHIYVCFFFKLKLK